MDKLNALLKRYKQAEEFFESEVDIIEKEQYIPAFREILNEITKEQKALNLNIEELKLEMIKAGIKVD